MEVLLRKSAAELEAECLRLLGMDPHTRGIKRVELIRLYPKGTGPNLTYGALDPMPTRAGLAIAQPPIASVYGRWALADCCAHAALPCRGPDKPPYVRPPPVGGPCRWRVLAGVAGLSLGGTGAYRKVS